MSKIISFLKSNLWKLLTVFFITFLFLQDRLVLKETFWNDHLIEYQSFSLYPFYFIVVLYFFGLFFYKIKTKEKIDFGPTWFLILSGISFTLILVTGLLGLNQFISLFFLFQFVLGFFCYLIILNLKLRNTFWQMLMIIFIALEALLGIIQVAIQSEIGLVFLIGEPVLNSSEFYIATVEWIGNRFLRAYGNLGHPNIFGGVVAVGLIFLTTWYLNWGKRVGKFKITIEFLLFILAFLLLYFGLLFSFSRSAWFAIAVILFFESIVILVLRFKKTLKTKSRKKLLQFNLLLIFCLLLSVLLFPNAIRSRFSLEVISERPLYTEQVSKSRYDYLAETEKLASSYWLKGVGMGNYVRGVYVEIDDSQKGSLYQPVHNIPLLIFIETGIFGLIAMLFFVFFMFKELFQRIKQKTLNKNLLFFASFISLFVLFFAGLFDHYLLTSMIGFFLTWILIGLALKDPTKS